VIEGIATTPKLRPLFEATRAIETQIGDRTINIGLVINTQDLLQANLDPSDRQQLGQFLQIFPQFRERDLYLRLEGQPQVKDNKVRLAPDSRVQIGNLTLTLKELAQKMGLSPAQMTQYLTIDAPLPQLQGITIAPDQMTLNIAPSP
jgi:hypothetical protein